MSRLFRRFPDVLAPEAPEYEDDGGESGSSRAPSPGPEPFARTQRQAVEQHARHLERRLRRAVRHGDAVAAQILRTETNVTEMEERLRTLTLRHGTVSAVVAVFEAGLEALSTASVGTPLAWPAP